MVGPFMTDEKGWVVRMVHLMYRCNKVGIRGRVPFHFQFYVGMVMDTMCEFVGRPVDVGHGRFGCLDTSGGAEIPRMTQKREQRLLLSPTVTVE